MTHQRVVITARGVFPTMVIQNIMQTPLSVMAHNVHQTRPRVVYVNVKHPTKWAIGGKAPATVTQIGQTRIIYANASSVVPAKQRIPSYQTPPTTVTLVTKPDFAMMPVV